jgi:hypothetical protein
MKTKNKYPRRDAFFLVTLSVAVLVLGGASVRDKSVTWDEPFYVGAGYYMLNTLGAPWHEYDTLLPTIAHPPMSYYLSSIPFFVYDAFGKIPAKKELFMFNQSEHAVPGVPICFECYPEKYSYRFIYGEEFKGLDLLFYSRCSTLLLLILACIYMFRFSKEHLGFETACLTTALFALNPNVLAHSALATTDIAPACFNIVSFYYFAKFMEDKNTLSSLKAGAGLGLALLSKVTSLYLVPLYIIVFIYDCVRQRREKSDGRQMGFSGLFRVVGLFALALSAATLTLNGGYLFKDITWDFTAPPQVTTTGESKALLPGLTDLGFRFPLPVPYLVQYAMQDNHLKGHDTYLNGAVVLAPGMDFRVEYWLATIGLKSPEGTIALAFIAASYYLLMFARRGAVSGAYPARVRGYLALNLLVALAFMLFIRVLIGVRLILFAFPFAYLLLGEPLKYMLSKGRAARAVTYALVALSLAPALTSNPNYISYFNYIGGGPENGYRYLSDSNVDWGQDLPALKEWMVGHGVEEINLAYFGRAKIEEHGIRYVSLPNNQKHIPTQRPAEKGCGPVAGILAISVNSYTGQYDNPQCYEWLRHMRPAGYAGYSILIFNVTEGDIQRI